MKDAEPVFMIDTLKALIDNRGPGNEACKQSFQKKMNEIYTVGADFDIYQSDYAYGSSVFVVRLLSNCNESESSYCFCES